jgi:hypothetical protein
MLTGAAIRLALSVQRHSARCRGFGHHAPAAAAIAWQASMTMSYYVTACIQLGRLARV